ncbi:MAG: hypothetical protein PVH42_06630 [Desulfobacterales bacterium]|jgi:hypothetical protein
MKIYRKYLLLPLCFGLFLGLCECLAEEKKSVSPIKMSLSDARLTGRLGDNRLVECSGMDTSLASDDLIWAINDNGHGPFIYAMRFDGRSMGRVLVVGAQNRDWEGIDTFLWQGRPMILIADFGDNRERYDTHTLYVVEEPELEDDPFGESSSVTLAWRIVFSYPDRKHDAESVFVDATDAKIFVLTKRDNPPLLFELPLKPAGHPIVAKKVAAVKHIPAPSEEDMLHKYGKYSSQPTSLDISPDGRQAVVLTYKHAYVFNRKSNDSWAVALTKYPETLLLPHPRDRSDFRQREAICFADGGEALLITSEGKSAAIFRLDHR